MAYANRCCGWVGQWVGGWVGRWVVWPTYLRLSSVGVSNHVRGIVQPPLGLLRLLVGDLGGGVFVPVLFVLFFYGKEVGGWVGGWVGWVEEKEAVGMSYCKLEVGWVSRGRAGGLNEYKRRMGGWVGGWENLRQA